MNCKIATGKLLFPQIFTRNRSGLKPLRKLLKKDDVKKSNLLMGKQKDDTKWEPVNKKFIDVYGSKSHVTQYGIFKNSFRAPPVYSHSLLWNE